MSRQRMKQIGIAATVLVILMSALFLSNILVSSFMRRQLYRQAEQQHIDLEFDTLRYSVFAGSLRVTNISAQSESFQFNAAGIETRLRVLGLLRAYRNGSLSDFVRELQSVQAYDLHPAWLTLENAFERAFLPRSFALNDFRIFHLIAMQDGAPHDSQLLASGSFESELSHDTLRAESEVSVQPAGLATLSSSFSAIPGIQTAESVSVDMEFALAPDARELRSVVNFSAADLAAGTLNINSVDSGSNMEISGSVSARLESLDFLSLTGLDYQLTYDFSGIFSPGRRLPRQHLDVAVYPEPPAAIGVLALNQGKLDINGFEIEADISLNGLFRKDSPITEQRYATFPETITLGFSAEGSDVSAAVSLLPESIIGELNTMQVNGQVFGRTEIIIPPGYLNGIEWDFNMSVEDLSIEAGSDALDVSALYDRFRFVIQDESVAYERMVEIPVYRRPSTSFIASISEHTPAWVENHWAEYRPSASTLASGEGQIGRGSTTDGESIRVVGNEAAIRSSQNQFVSDTSYEYVYLEDMSQWIIAAVLTAEDGDFFFHQGYDWNTVSDAIARNVLEGEIVFGASTLSMQLVKNLFLSGDREFDRKIQEIMLVYVMEEYINLPKDRILELYINLVEFGPGIFGVQDAARHYFGVDASDLSIGQAVWLASILPSPKRYHSYYENGAISPGWFERMMWIFDTMLERGRIQESEYLAATRRPPQFYYGR